MSFHSTARRAALGSFIRLTTNRHLFQIRRGTDGPLACPAPAFRDGEAAHFYAFDYLEIADRVYQGIPVPGGLRFVDKGVKQCPTS